MTMHHYILIQMSITIKVVSAQLTRDTEFFSNMDPYCILRLGAQTQRTNTKSEAGKKPVWNQSFRFSNADNNLRVIVMDEDNVSDDMVGEGEVDISRFRNSSAQQEHIVQLYFHGKAAGKVMLRISGSGGMQGNNYNQGQNTWGNTQPNNQWQQNNQWGGNQNNGWGMPPQQNNQWGTQPQSSWGNQNNGWNQPPPPQFANQGGNQWGAQGGINQQQPNMNQFNPILQGIVQGSNQWGQQGTNPQANQWGNQQPPNSQWGNNPQAANQAWGNNNNPKPNDGIVYPDLEYKPPISNNYNQPSNPQGNNMNVPYQLIGGMQGLFGKPNNNGQGGNPYQV